ncbi:MAG TPA: hypothetical protein VNB24_06275 [Acidimicrobiales bacterium]|nr:hypothetical protein [Acidimicrobiales bacterium]
MRRALAAAVAALLIGNGAALAMIDRPTTNVETDPQRPRPSAKSDDKVEPPKEWDPRVAKLAAYVESERGLQFKHPVAVSFLDTEAYRKEIRAGSSAELTAEDKEEIEIFTGQARALGLLRKDTDLLEATGEIVDEGTLAFYDPERDRMVVKGTKLTVGVRVTVVHELTHALQDQHFDLTKEFDDDGSESIHHALVEGDAVRIETAYASEELSGSETRDYLNEQQDAREGVELGDIPPALLHLFTAPYQLGAPMTTIVAEEQGQDALNKLFRDPPGSDEGVINPFALIDREKTADVAKPARRAGETATDDGDFGVLTWYVVLASFIDARTAIEAVDGWSGDAYSGYTKAGRACLRAHFVGDTDRDAREMEAALVRWKQAFPPEGVTVTREGPRVELDACEPDSIPKPVPSAEFALALPQARLEIVAQALAAGATVDVARCFSREFVRLVDLDSLDDDDASAFNELIEAMRAKCL